MECRMEHPPPLRRYTLQFYHGGKIINTWGSYQNYVGGKAFLVRNLYVKEAKLDLFKKLATRLGYKKGFELYYRRFKDGVFLEVEDDGIVPEIISRLSAVRELDIYLVNGVREQTQLEEYPAIMYWNCQCLNDKKINQLRAVNLIYQANILFLSETRMTSSFSSPICLRLGFHDFEESPAKRHMEDLDNCVGLAMFWKKDVELEFEDGSENFLEFMVKVSDSKRYRLIGVYGNPKDKSLTWILLKELSDASRSPENRLVIGGDFNEILTKEEKRGGTPKEEGKMKAFNNALAACKLDGLPYEGSPFTWTGGPPEKRVKERLDRVVARVSWKDLFTRHRVLHVTDRLISDHIPILLQTDSEKHKQKISNSEVFGFIEEMKQAYMNLTNQDVTTVSRMELESFEGIKRDLCYVAVDLVAPHLIQQYDIMVLDKHNIVTRECLVTLTGVHNIRVLLLNSIDSPKPSREYKLAILPQFPSCGINRNSLNLSKYIAETWSLIKFIPTDGKQESREKIVNEIVVQQVQNLITWFDEVCTRDVEPTGSDIKPLKVKLEERASMIGRAVIVFDIIMYQLGKKGIQHEGAITELQEKLCSACEYYFGQITTEIDSEEKIGLPLQFLLKIFQWRQYENPLQYRIPESSKDNYEDLFAIVITQMLEAERDVVVIDDSWIKLLINNERTESEKLVKCVIECQLELLKRIGCISCSEDDEIALFSDENCESVTKQLQEAASEAFKTLSRKKTSMTSTTYVGKLKDAYKKSASNKKREMVGDGEKQGEKKARN